MSISTFLEHKQLKFDKKGNHSFSFALSLLQDNDPDTVLQAIQVLNHLKDPRALEMLRSLLYHPDPNVVQAAIITIGHLGDDRSVSDIVPFLKSDSWLKMAAIKALGELRSSLAVRPLANLLSDPVTGSLAAEALARIGGTTALRALSKNWLKFHSQLDTEIMLGLLAHVIEGVAKKPPKIHGLRKSIIPYLDDPSDTIRLSAAQCVLALGSGPDDKKALAILADNLSYPQILPACLKNRNDLIPYLLNTRSIQQVWGFQLVSLFPKDTPIPILKAATGSYEHYEYLDCIVNALQKIKDPAIVPAILDLYIRIPIPYRYLLNPLLRIHKKLVRSLLIDTDVDDETRLVISSFLGIAPICIALEILDLHQISRIFVISQITDCKAILKSLPWIQWIEDNPGFYAPVAAEVAVKANLSELLPVLREILAVYPVEQIIRAAGEFRDKESVPILVSHLDKTSSYIKSLILEILGRIGGSEARETLRNAALTLQADESRIAYKALSGCGTEEDSAFFRNVISSNDWYIRLACAEFLSRFPSPENLEAIAELANDPVSVIAQRALFFLKCRLKGLCRVQNLGGYNENQRYGDKTLRIPNVKSVRQEEHEYYT